MRVTGLTLTGLGQSEDGRRWPRVLPGEEIDADGRILSPSADRVSAPCRHYKGCGGCSMQHASDEFVAGWKTEVVTRALHARGLPVEIETVSTSPPQSRRRAKFSGRRTRKGAIVGLHGRSSDTITEVTDCQVITPGLKAVLPALERLTGLGASRKSELDLTVTDSDGGPDIAVSGGREVDQALLLDLTALAQENGIARLSWNGETLLTMADPDHVMGQARVVPPPGAFLQATRDGEAALVAHVLKAMAGAFRVIDLFSGCGTFALPLASTAEVHAVEGQPAMLAALDRAWRMGTGLRRVTTEARDLFRNPLTPPELGADGVVIDPPRAGSEAQVAEVAAAGVPVVAMVSCNPVTFARDAAALVAGGYQMGPATIIDQFRWSAHVELCATFTMR